MYSIPALNSKYDLVIDELNQIGKTLSFTTFDLARLKKEAKNIKDRVDIASGFALLGMISCLERDEMAVRKSFEKAIQQSGGDVAHIINFAIALKTLGFMEEAYRLTIEAYEKDPLNKDFIEYAIELACVLNNKEDFNNIVAMWHKLTEKEYPLKSRPLFREVNPKECFDFRENFMSNHELSSKYLNPDTLFKECGPEIVHIFGAPLNIVVDVMPDPDSNPNLVAWIQWFGEMDEGMRLFDQFERWYIDNDYDLKTNVVSFNIEFMGA